MKILDDGAEVFVTSDKKVYRVGEGFLVEMLISTEDIKTIIQSQENPSILAVHYTSYVGIYDIINQDWLFKLCDPETIDSVYYLNEDILITYNQMNSHIKAYD